MTVARRLIVLAASSWLLSACDDGGSARAGRDAGGDTGDTGAGDAADPDAGGQDVVPADAGDPCAPAADGLGTPPGGRSGARMVYDPPRDRLWLFGGDTRHTPSAGEDPLFTDQTWVFTFCPKRWENKVFVGQASPRKRGGHAVVHDELNARVFVVGGRTRNDFNNGIPAPEESYSLLNDVWKYDLEEDRWEEVQLPADAPRPPGLHGHSAVYDPGAKQLIVFGGIDKGTFVGGCAEAVCIATLAQTWVLDLSRATPSWTRIEGAVPPRRQDHGSVFDPRARKALVTGGTDYAGSFHGDVWTFDAVGRTWSEITPASARSTPARAFPAVAYGSNERSLVYFGGAGSDGRHNDVHLFSLDSHLWVLLVGDVDDDTAPSPRAEAAMVHLSSGRFAVFGGESAEGVDSDLWIISSDDKTWEHISP